MSGGQLELIEAVINTGTPTVIVIMAGRPQTFGVETNVSTYIYYKMLCL
jgi:hypothetical protein